MKFSCERCGKKYATAEKPAPGRVYKIKCKACGHLIVVKASAGATSTATTEMRPPTSVGMPALDLPPPAREVHPHATPDIHLEVGPPEPATLPGGAYAGMSQISDATQEISMTGISSAPEEQFTPPPADAGYVDLFEDGPKQEPETPAEDPFLAAARASLPESYNARAAAPDPFATLREEFSTPAPERHSPPPVPVAAPGPSTLPKIPVIRKPSQQKSTLPLMLIGAGALVLVGILAFVLLGGGSGSPPPPQAQVAAPVPQPAPPAPPPAAAPQPPPPAAPVATAPPPEKPQKADKPDRHTAEDDRRAREERRAREREKEAREREAREARERDAREARASREARDRDAREAREREKAAREARAREEREAKERDRLAREQRAREEREAKDRERQRREADKVAAASLPDEDAALSQAAIEKVLSSTRKAFENCIVTSGKAGEVKLDGRRVMLRLNIQNTGAVTYPTFDDVTLNGTELGSCLKSAARLMVFPKFKGDTMHIEVPLVLAGR